MGPERRSPDDVKRAVWFRCKAARECGGCQLAHLPYAQQLAFKQARVEKLLDRFCPVSPILGMEDPFHYRTKVHAVMAADAKGRPYAGVYAAGTHRVVPVRRCLLEDEQAGAIIQSCVELADSLRVRIYDEDRRRGLLRHVVVRVGCRQIMAVLVTAAEDFPQGQAFAAELKRRHPAITTVVQNVNPLRTSMVLGRKDIPLLGEGAIEDELLGLTFRISPQSFYQVNARQTGLLYRTAIGLAQLSGKETILDAYCGTGTIGLCAAGHAASLIGVELNRAAVEDARINAARNGIRHAVFHCGDAGRFLTRMAREGGSADVVFMDPPRTGSDMPFLRSLLTLSPPRMIYVSCCPETLARDLGVLTCGGYRAVSAVPVDMFPGTEHVETVCLLCRQKKDFISVPYEPKDAEYLNWNKQNMKKLIDQGV